MDDAILHLLCFILLLLAFPSKAQTYQNISLGNSLSSRNTDPKWVSPSGEFAFGFYPLPGNKDAFLLAIWFDKIPEKTVVWVANRKENPDNPVLQRGSTVELTTAGQLILKDPGGQQVWQAQYFGGTVVSATMLDTGNFALQSSDFDFKWQSFDNPTDTILPTQILRSNRLSSNLAETNYSIGRFELRMQSDGNLVLYLIARPSTFKYKAYWASNTPAIDGSLLVFNQSGYIYLQLPNGSFSNFTQRNGIPEPARNFYHRVTLDYDGLIRQYFYPKAAHTNGSWSQSWSQSWNIPDDPCRVGGEEMGSGACGYNGYCTLENNKANCLCPRGYSYIDENYRFKGCKPDFALVDCQQDRSQFEFQELINTDWPTSDIERYYPVDEGFCRKACLDDCFCAAAIHRDSDCWKKKFPLSNGRMNTDVRGKALIKVPIGNSSFDEPGPRDQIDGRGRRENGPLFIVGSVILGSSVFLNVILLLATFLFVVIPCYRKQQKMELGSWKLDMNLRPFTYKELEEATNGFKEELGKGAFGTVYKGELATTSSATCVAVKKLDKVVQEGEKEFRTEVSVIGQTHHKNLVKLLGFCDEESHRLLVYEFMSNGCLASFLFGSSRPNWNQRVRIAFGIARGLMYLHEECTTQIIHCDIKPQNILLDGGFTAKISDFGLAKLLMNEQTRTATVIRGTKGYVAPEWFKNMPITVKVDVYSFGVMLLEIICCRKNVEQDLMDEDGEILTYWAYDCFKENRLDLLVENDEEAANDRRKLERMVMVAFWCVQEEPSLRPSMKKVTQMLEGAVEVAIPPDPSSFIGSLD